MKVDFVKEVNGNVIWYYTSVDGEYVAGSISHDSEKAIEFYEKIISGNAKPNISQNIIPNPIKRPTKKQDAKNIIPTYDLELSCLKHMRSF
jgi:hypothetical protein